MLYPQQWLIGKDGRVAWLTNDLELDTLRAEIEAALAE